MVMKIYIRASMLPSWNDCPRRSAAQQYRKIITGTGYRLNETLPSIGGSVGTSVHSGSEHTLKNMLSTGVQAKKKECFDVGIETFKKLIVEGAVFDNITPTGNVAEQQILQMINAYYIQVAPKLTISRIENQYEIEFDDDVIFTGKSDVETTDNFIRDIKGGVKPKPFHAQLGGYSLLRGTDTGIKSAGLVIDYLPRVSAAKSYPGASTFNFDVGYCESMAWHNIRQIANSVREFLKTGSCWSFPCNPMSIICSEKYCPAFGTDFCEVRKH
jgi:hypothetical protein